MREVLTALLLFITTPCVAQVTVSDRLPPPVTYPAEVYRMSGAEFYRWATDFNQKQAADWKKRKAEITEPEWIYGSETLTDCSDVGYGFGGPYRPWNGFGFDRPWNGFGFGSGLYGGDYYNLLTQRQVTIPRQWRNQNYAGPGPLILVNPYCPPKETP